MQQDTISCNIFQMAERTPTSLSLDDIFGARHDHPFTGETPEPLFPGKMRDAILRIHEGLQSGLTGEEIYTKSLEGIDPKTFPTSTLLSSQSDLEG